MKLIAVLALGLASGVTVPVVSGLMWNSTISTKIHVLTQPMLISSVAGGKVMHLLPAGTTLYLDKSYPEGFTRYRVYVNVDRMPLSLRELPDPNEIDPLEARAFDKPALAQALRDYPLTPQDLAAILQSPHLTRQEIREVFNEYLEENK